MDLTALFVVCVVVWLICGTMAAHIASDKKAEVVGFWYGVLLGPCGVIAAGFLDKRFPCPRCGGRLNSEKGQGFAVCQHCGADLDWTHGQPLTLEMVESLKSEPEYCDRPKFDEWGNPLDTDKGEMQPEGEAVGTAAG